MISIATYPAPLKNVTNGKFCLLYIGPADKVREKLYIS